MERRGCEQPGPKRVWWQRSIAPKLGAPLFYIFRFRGVWQRRSNAGCPPHSPYSPSPGFTRRHRADQPEASSPTQAVDSSSSRPRALARNIPPVLALRRVLWTLNLCKYHPRVANHQHFQKRTYLARPEMAVGRWSTSVISALSSDTEPTIILTFDNAKYIFNAGENTGRAWMQRRAHWRRMKAVFFTQTGTQRMGGMPGMGSATGALLNPKIIIRLRSFDVHG